MINLFKYLKNRLIIFFNDIVNDDFNSIEHHHNKFTHNLYEWVNFHINKEMSQFEIEDNEFYIKLKNLDNIWIKINNHEVKVIKLIENNDDYQELKEELILSKDFINHALFHQNINKEYKEKSKWKIRLNNYNYIRRNLKNIEFDFTNIKVKKTININSEIISSFFNKKNGKKCLFFRALKEDAYENLLCNYNLDINYVEFYHNYYYYSRGINYVGNVSDIEELLNKSRYKDFFQNISLTRTKSLLLSEYNYDVNLNNILNMTEAFFQFKIHKDSFFYEKMIRDLKNERLSTYFILVRMCVYNNLIEILGDVKEYINEDMLNKFNKLNDALLFILDSNQLLESNVVINGRYLQVFNKELGISTKSELGEHESLITELLNSSDKKINQHHFKFLDVICELMDNEIVKFDRDSARDMLLKTRKVLLNHKLENKLNVKEVKKKVIKI